MDLINTGNGYLTGVVSVAVIAFLILLAAFIAVNVTIARRYHASRHLFAEEARRLPDRVAAAGTPWPGHAPATPGNTR